MTGRDMVLAAFRREKTPRAPWVPFTGVHAANLAGYTATEVLLDADKLVTAALAAHQLYRPDGQPVLFDLQIEAEILGCELRWADDAPPSVVSHILADKGYAALAEMRLPEPTDGRIPVALEATRRLKQEIGQDTALFGLVTGPFTLASHLRGVDIFLDMFDAPEHVHQLLAFCGQVAQRMASFYMQAGADVIAVVDPMISQVSADHFREFVAGESRQVFDVVRQAGKASSYFVCGNAANVLEAMAECGPDGVSVDENVNLDFAREIAERFNISFGGNIPLTTVMLFGNEADNMSAVFNLTQKYAGPGYILAPGCDIPFNVPVNNIAALTLAIFDPEKARAALANSTKGGALAGIEVQLPDYSALTRPLVELITLDSDTCPPCKYMVDATKEVAGRIPGGIDWVEYKITKPENVARMQALGVTNLPTIVINGQVTFISRIPDQESYRQAILAAMPGKEH